MLLGGNACRRTWCTYAVEIFGPAYWMAFAVLPALVGVVVRRWWLLWLPLAVWLGLVGWGIATEQIEDSDLAPFAWIEILALYTLLPVTAGAGLGIGFGKLVTKLLTRTRARVGPR